MTLYRLSISTLFLTLLIFSGCSTKTGPAPEISMDATLPGVSVRGSISDVSAIAFEWAPLSDARTVGVRIYRDNPLTGTENLVRIASIQSRQTTHYVDNALQPGTTYHYRFSSFDAEGKESQPSKTMAIATLKAAEPVSFFTGSYHPESVLIKLIWRPHTNARVVAYEIERQLEGSETFRFLARIDGRLHAEFVDTRIEQMKRYRYRIRAITFEGYKSDFADEITISTRPAPQAPAMLSTSSTLLDEIRVTWETVDDAQTYAVYRALNGTAKPTRVATTTIPLFVDKTEGRYFYRVSAIDVDAQEGQKSAGAWGKTAPKPTAPVLTELYQEEDGSVTLKWTNDDPKTTGYVIVKTTRLGFGNNRTAEFKGVTPMQFNDIDVVPGREYLYRIIAVDAKGVRSKASEERSITPESMMIELP